MRETNFKYRPISDVEQQNETDENGKISKHPAGRSAGSRGDLLACRGAGAAQLTRQIGNSIWTVSAHRRLV